MSFGIRFIALVLFSSLIMGCSFQKRTLMPGYYVEWVGGQNEPSVSHASPDDLAQLEWALAGSLPNELPAAELNTSSFGKLYPVQVRKAQPIPPKRINKATPAVALADPTPWAETYEEQRRFENIALAAFAVAGLLAAIGAPEAFSVVVGLIGFMFGFLSRRKRMEVLEIKEVNGYDVTAEREQIKRKNQLMVVFMGLTAVVGIVFVVWMISLVDGFFEWLFS